MIWEHWSFSVKQWSVLSGPEQVSSRAVCGSNSSSAGPQGWWFLECKIDTGFILKECVQFRSVCEEVLICAPTHFLLYSRSNFLELFLCVCVCFILFSFPGIRKTCRQESKFLSLNLKSTLKAWKPHFKPVSLEFFYLTSRTGQKMTLSRKTRRWKLTLKRRMKTGSLTRAD